MKLNFIKIVSLVLILIMSVTALVACQQPGEPNESSKEESPFPTDPQEPEEILADIEIAAGVKTSFNVVRGENAPEYEKSAAVAVKSAILEKSGAMISIVSDWVKESAGIVENEYEILVGRVDRSQSEDIYTDLRAKDYTVTIRDKKIIIAAYTEEKLTEAVEHFVNSLVVTDGKLILPASACKAEKAEYAVDEVKLNNVSLSGYKIIYKAGASEQIKAAAEKLHKKLCDDYGYDLSVKTDSLEQTAYEIVIGGTNRGNSLAEIEKLRSLDYKLQMEEGRVYVMAGDDSVDAAVEALLQKLAGLELDRNINASAEDIFVDYKSSAYKTEQILLNGTPIEEYTIVYSRTDKMANTLAQELNSIIQVTCGRSLDIISDGRPNPGTKIILVGYSESFISSVPEVRRFVDSVGKSKYVIYGEGDIFYVGGVKDSSAALTAATNAMKKAIVNGDDPKQIKLDYTVKESFAIKGTTYTTMSYNDGANKYDNPKDRCEIIKEYMPDILCFQETQLIHTKIYKARLEVYDFVYFDNDGTTYNSQPIYYKRDMFELLDSGIKWLSDTPDKRSKYKESEYIRSFTYAVLKDKETGLEIVIVNTHIDYTSAATAKQTERLIELTECFRDRPTFYFGDFNMHRSSEGYSNMVKGGLEDTGSYLGDMTSVIDFCFMDPTMSIATGYKIVNDHELSSVASDHPAIYSEVLVLE